MARQSMEKAGVDRTNWKFAATMDTMTMRNTTKDLTKERAAVLLNAMARARVASPEAARAVALAGVQLLTGGRNGRENTVIALSLLFQEMDPEEEAGERHRFTGLEVRDVFDYVHEMSRDNGPVIRSTTWAGLRRRSEEWHRQLQEDPINRQWKNTLAGQDNMYQAWHSCLGRTDMNGLTIIPLTSQKDLYEESLAMSHCVIGYGDQCASGQSRIFSIRSGDKRIATGEIRPNGRGWTESQTRGPRNHAVSNQVKEAMDTVAEMYTKAASPPGAAASPNRSWWVHAETGQTAEEETLQEALT